VNRRGRCQQLDDKREHEWVERLGDEGREASCFRVLAARDRREHAKAAGFAAFVAKPLDPFVLALVVKLLAAGTPVH